MIFSDLEIGDVFRFEGYSFRWVKIKNHYEGGMILPAYNTSKYIDYVCPLDRPVVLLESSGTIIE